MLDKRIALISEDRIEQYSILSIIGRGANCLVYSATYADNIEETHTLIVKEFFPVYLKLNRNKDNILHCDESEKEQFEIEKKRFEKTYRTNILLRNQSGLMNSTNDVIELIAKNNTLYVISKFNQGEDYYHYKDTSVEEVLKHVKAVAKVIQKYHEKGYLYLDIKPENIFVIPETAEHIILFDFDSIVSIDDLKNNRICAISYSEGFSAPEQLRGRVKDIGTYTDIYSVGALLFFKLFGRIPGFIDIQFGAELPMEEFQYDVVWLPPQFEKKLNYFFRNTISISRYSRLQNMSEVISLLDEMIPMVNADFTFVHSNFVYSESLFSGRTGELDELHFAIKTFNKVFLSGIGGIGKTELARRYAYIHKEEFDTIIFLHYEHSILETITSDDLMISNMEFDKVSLAKCFEKKLNVLKLLSENNLIIIDNFDALEEEQFNQLINILESCKCKFIITTRNDYRDSGYKQIVIDCMKSNDDCMSLFFSNNDVDYADEELTYIKQIIALVDNHTMMIVLLAKYLRVSGESPKTLFYQFQRKEGVSNVLDVSLMHRKDKRSMTRSVMNHLRTLFDLSNFTASERKVLMALSLLGPVRIKKNLLLNIMGDNTYREVINILIHKGWIEAVEDEKISLHQVVLDLIYTDLKPDTNNCNEFIKCMVRYFQGKEEVWYLKKAKKRLADSLLERVKGEDIVLAELYYEYCKNMRYDCEFIDQAEKICLNSSEIDANLILAKINVLKLTKFDTDESLYDEDEVIAENKVYVLYDELFQKIEVIFECLRKYMVLKYKLRDMYNCNEHITIEKAGEIDEMLRERFFYALEKGYPLSSYLSDSTGEVLYQTAIAELYYVNRVCEEYCVEEEAFDKGFYVFYYSVESILLFLYKSIRFYQNHFSYEWKEKVLKELLSLYEMDYYDKPAQSSCLHRHSSKKQVFFSNELMKLRRNEKKDQKISYLEEISYLEAAENELYWYNYLEAIALFELAKNEGEPIDEVNYGLSKAYMEIGRYDFAEKELLDVLEYQIEKGIDPCFTYKRLEKLYERSNHLDKALDMCKRILSIQVLQEKQEDALKWLVIYRYKMKEIQQNGEVRLEKEEFFELEKNLERLVSERQLEKEMVGVLKTYYYNSYIFGSLKTAFRLMHQAANEFRLQQNEDEAYLIYRELIGNEKLKRECKGLYIQLLVEMAEMYIWGKYAHFGMAYNLLDEARRNINKDIEDYSYWFSKINLLTITIIENSFVEDNLFDLDKLMRECDFYLIAKRDVHNNYNIRSGFEIWNQTTYYYICLHNDEMVEKSLMELQSWIGNSYQYFRKYFITALSWYESVTGEERFYILRRLFEFYLNMFHKCSSGVCLRDDILSIFASKTMKNSDYDYAILFYLMEAASELDQDIYNCLKENGFNYLGQEEEYEKIIERLFEDDKNLDKKGRCVQILTALQSGLEKEYLYEALTEKIGLLKSKYEQYQIEFKH